MNRELQLSTAEELPFGAKTVKTVLVLWSEIGKNL